MNRPTRIAAGTRRTGAWLLAVLALLLATGCSSGVRIGYNQAEMLVGWTLSDYVEFEPHQRDLFGQKFRALHDWHRREQLPEYARLLREARDRVEDGLTRDDIDWMIARSLASSEGPPSSAPRDSAAA